MKVLVLGGTGAMGVHLVQMLAQRGIETVVTSRSKKVGSANLRYAQGDAQDINFLRPLLREPWDAIVDFMVYTTAGFQSRVGELLAATSQYVFISTARVYADSERPIAEESKRLLDHCADPKYLLTDDYALTKARQEDLLKKSGKTNWTIVRPYITYDTQRLQLGVLEKEEWLYRALHGRTIIFSADIASRLTTLTSGFDVANGIAALVGNGKALGETFHITAPEPILWADVLDIYITALKKHMGAEPKVILQGMDSFLQSKPARYQIAYDRMYHRRFDCTKISAVVPVQGFVRPETGLQHAIEAFLQNPVFLGIDWKQEAIRDRQAGEWTPLNEIAAIKHKLKYLIFRLFSPQKL